MTVCMYVCIPILLCFASHSSVGFVTERNLLYIDLLAILHHFLLFIVNLLFSFEFLLKMREKVSIFLSFFLSFFLVSLISLYIFFVAVLFSVSSPMKCLYNIITLLGYV